MTPFEFLEPDSSTEAIGLINPDDLDVRPIAGGTALMLMMKAGVFRPRRLVSLRKLSDDYTRIARGAVRRTRHRRHDAARGARTIAPKLRAPRRLIVRAMRRLANVRVRNVATVGGALAHGDPHMDLPPVLMALGAAVAHRRRAGERTCRSRTCSPAITRPCWPRTN